VPRRHPVAGAAPGSTPNIMSASWRRSTPACRSRRCARSTRSPAT
jgi:hypothetical protein